MARPSKPASVLIAENKSHRTKAEIKTREESEKALSSGTELKERAEVKNNPTAHKEFLRLNKLLCNIGKNDAFYENVINRYCMITAECIDLENKREKIFESAQKIEANSEDIENAKLVNDMYKTMVNIDRQIQTKRMMLLSIEKENIMTVASSMRSVVKTPDKNDNPLLKALRDE